MCVCDHLCVYTLIQIYIIYTIFVLSFKIKMFLNKIKRAGKEKSKDLRRLEE